MILNESASVEALAKAHNWNIPTKCPKCGGDVEINDKHTLLFCINPDCPSKGSGTIAKWVMKIGAKEFGPASINALQSLGVTTISDLYNPEYYKELAEVDGFGQNSAQKMYKELLSHSKITPAVFLSGYNIRSCGEKIIEKIIEAKPDLMENFPFNITNFSPEEIVASGIGLATAKKFIDGINANIKDMEKTLSYVTIIKEEKKTISTDSKLGGKSFCFTGAASIPRKQLWQMVEDNGGVIHESVKTDTNYLVVADPNSTSGKVQSAKKKGVAVISEEEFFNMCK